MVEDVSTGGLKKFSYSGDNMRLDDERRQAIAEGYRMAEERKAKERKRRRIIFVIAIVVILIILGVLALFALK